MFLHRVTASWYLLCCLHKFQPNANKTANQWITSRSIDWLLDIQYTNTPARKRENRRSHSVFKIYTLIHWFIVSQSANSDVCVCLHLSLVHSFNRNYVELSDRFDDDCVVDEIFFLSSSCWMFVCVVFSWSRVRACIDRKIWLFCFIGTFFLSAVFFF